MSSIAGSYESYYPQHPHAPVPTLRSTPRTVLSPLDDGSISPIPPSPRPRTRITPTDESVSSDNRQQQINNSNKHRKRDRKRNRYRRSATLSPAAVIRRRCRFENDDSNDSNDDQIDEIDFYQFISPTVTTAPQRTKRSLGNTGHSKNGLSPLQTTPSFSNRRVQRKPELPSFARNSLLRKTCSEPTDLFADECDRNKVERIQDILNSLDFTKFHLIHRKSSVLTSSKANISPIRPQSALAPSIPSPLSPSNSQSTGGSSPLITPSQSPDETWATPRGSIFVPNQQSSDRSIALSRCSKETKHESEDSDFVSTDIEELREAAQTIEALRRRHRHCPTDLILDEGNNAEKTPELITTPIAPQLPSLDQCDQNIQQESNIHEPKNNETLGSTTSLSSTSTLRYGITTRLRGQPRGVMQFLQSVRSSEFLPKTAYESYLANKSRRAYQNQSNESPNSDILSSSTATNMQMLRRKVSMPDQLFQAGQDRYHSYRHYKETGEMTDQNDRSIIDTSCDDFLSSDRKMSAPVTEINANKTQQRYNYDDKATIRTNKLARQFSQFDRQYSDNAMMTIDVGTASIQPEPSSFKGIDNLSSFSRFGRLLKSLKNSRQNSPEMETISAVSPASSDSPLSSPCPSEMSPSNTVIHRRRHRHNGDHAHRSINRSLNHGDDQSMDAQRSRSQAGTVANTIIVDGGSMSQSWHGGVSKMHYDLNSLAALGSSGGTVIMSDSDSSMMQADLLLWQKRSKGSLRRHQDTRAHIVKELYDTESSYVDNLQLIVHKYLRPLKRPELCTLIDPTLVDEIFFQIPEILGHHELFFAALKSRSDNWDNRQKIGDIILNNFTKQSVIDTYTAFINNWKNARHAIRAACQAKPSFAKYLERSSREHRNKLTLDALLIMPVQRIPRYELLIKELLKHTSVEHPDHPLLIRAQKEIHELATKINHVEQEAGLAEQMMQRLREIEAIVDGLDDSRAVKKERCLFLFSDQLIITNVKRKSTGALRKMPMVIPSSTPSCNFLESNKFKLLMKISLDDLEITKNNTNVLQKIQEEIVQLQEDLRVLGKISELLVLLKMQHDDVNKEVEKLKDFIRKQLSEKQHEMTTNPLLISLDLLVTTEAGIETLSVTFQSADKRLAWEKCFNDAKEALALSLTRRPPPVFLKPIAAQKTRSGLHYTCASATIGRNEHGYPNVWICNSDGYVGQVCVMTLTPEAEVSSCNGITNSRILCVCAVPDAKHSSHRRSRKNSTGAISPISQQSSPAVDSGYNLELDSESSDNESTTDFNGTTKHAPESSITSADMVTSSSSSGIEQNMTTLNSSPSSFGVDQQRKKSSKSITSPSTNDGVTSDPIQIPVDDLQGPTMWLGTEDGCIHVFNYNDSVRTRKNKLKIQHGASVLVITHVDDRVFVALGDGSLLYYDRDQDGNWDLDQFRFVDLEQLSRGPISAMLGVTNRMWMGIRNRVCILNPQTLKAEHVFQASSDVDSVVGCMSTSGLGVWLSIQGSPVIKLHHAHSYECLLEVNVSPTVTKTLAGCDDIIRQHKLSCLRVTTLLCCKDYLWIGTSAGVLLHLALPHITHNTTRLTCTPGLSSVSLGHSGQCRFLTFVELTSSNLSQSNSRTGSHTMINELSRRRMSLNVATLQQGKVYVISGGDGFEDFQDLSNDDGDDNTGRDDSTNHILIWQS